MKDSYTKISINITLLFTISMLISFIPELLPDLFFTEKCQGRYFAIEENIFVYHGCTFFDVHDPTSHWNFRHYLFSFMSLILFIVQSIKIINDIKK